MAQTTAVVLASRPNGEPTHENLRIEVRQLPVLGEGQVLLRTIYLSLDPYMRGRMDAGRSYAAPVEVGEVMEAATVCEVVESTTGQFGAGDIVLARAGWQTHSVQDASNLRRIDAARAPISTALGILGMTSFAAYVGVNEIGCPLPGETFVVAAAAGPVGSVAGQIARLRGARVVGIAGGQRKVEWLESIGFDAALNHRSPTFLADLAAAVPHGIDVYFENVGGAVGDAAFSHLNDLARVPVCGLVAQYNSIAPPIGTDRLPELMKTINTRRLRVQGFTQRDYITTHYQRFESDITDWMTQGVLHYAEDIVEGIENAPEAFFGMLRGENFGKLIVRVSPDPTRE